MYKRGYWKWYRLLRKQGGYGILTSFSSSFFNTSVWPDGPDSVDTVIYVLPIGKIEETSTGWGSASTFME
jgi:hypothetical protein|tara:strand:- start:520 stop:729 length:210 start_codon:yes stop_codon:yes gene_type:complete